MPAFETESLLQPVSPEQPCGPDLQYEADFVALEKAMQGKPEQQYGETIIPAEDPDWKEASRIALSLLPRTKDLRVGCHLARASLEIDGLAGFCQCLALIRGYVERYWDSVHPLLDPEDDNDPTERVNILASLADKGTTIEQLFNAPLVRSSVLGSFSMRDVSIAKGEIPPGVDKPPVDMSAIEACFMDSNLDELRERTMVVGQGHADAVEIEAFVTQQVGAAKAVSMEELSHSLKSIQDYLDRQFRVLASSQQSAYAGEAGLPNSQELGGVAQGGAAGALAISGEIRSRDDVIRTLDKICAYYDRFEPSSPLPLLLKRARRLVTKSFIDILEDLTPDGLSQARLIGGMDQSDDEQ